MVPSRPWPSPIPLNGLDMTGSEFVDTVTQRSWWSWNYIRSRTSHRIALEYSLLVVRFSVLSQNLTQLREVKGQIFVNSAILKLYKSIIKNINCIETTPSPLRSLCNSEQTGVLCYGRIFVMYGSPERNNITITGKFVRGKLDERPSEFRYQTKFYQ